MAKNFRNVMRGGPKNGPINLESGEKSRDFKASMHKLLIFLRPFYGRLSIVLVLAIGSTVFSIFGPKILGEAVDVLVDGIHYQQLIHILFFLGIIYLASALLGYIQEYMMAGISQEIIRKLREDVNLKLHKLPLSYYDTKSHGEILSRVTNDIDTIAGTLQQSAIQLMTSVITLVGITFMMLTISPLMTLIIFVSLPLSFLITGLIASRSQKFFKGQARELGKLNGHIEEMFGGHAVIKVFNNEKRSVSDFSKINNRLYNDGWKAQFVTSVIFPILNFTSNLTFVAICVLGGYLTANGRITLGAIQAFITYSRQFNHPIQQVSQIVNILQSTVAAAERVFEILEEKERIPEPEDPQVIEHPEGKVDFDNISFSYVPEKPLIQNLNIHVDPGHLIAIVGPTGAGKTTLVNLLMRFYELNSGKIYVDDVDISQMKHKELHAQIGMVLQDTWLFKGTIRENIAYGKRGATHEEVVQAAKLALADGFIRTLPDGYDTQINEEANNISQGQKQLITIARALIVQANIMILDEATSSVDTRTEILIQNAMKNIMKDHTSFVIAHRLSTIRDADNILVMNKGNIVEQGTHDELLRAKGFYCELYHSQFAQAGE